MLKKHFSIIKKIETKTTTTTELKNELKYFPMSEGKTCTAEANLEVLKIIQ